MSDLFSKKQLEQIQEKGIEVEKVVDQIEKFKSGFPFLKLIKPAILKEGLLSLNQKEVELLNVDYDKNSKDYEIVKFVPASGAATRMFKDLFQFMSKIESSSLEIEIEIEVIKKFFLNIKNFAFYSDLRHALEEDEKDLEKLIINKQYLTVLEYLLKSDGLNYGSLPKGLLKFHNYNGFSRTPVEEHFVEAAEYAKQGNNRANIHFTISSEHISLFKEQFVVAESKLEEKYKIKYDVSFSVQKPSTDTVAVDMENNPFIEENENILFRPGGHGALLDNLNDINADIVFIKNIDNVVPDHLKPDTIKYKKVIGGLLLKTKEKVFSYLFKLDELTNVDEKLISEIKAFIEKELYMILPDDFNGLALNDKKDYLHKILNRPIRVCGMVKNEGEPGGGPFWVKSKDGIVSLQIAETSQIEVNNPEQKKLMDGSTHFNPVDLVCFKKDYKGNLFNLLEFRDPETGFISKKSKDGRELKAQELPGLWNGSMANWNTLFVEVPLSTFNPVKTVNDLLRDQHQKSSEKE